MHAITACTIMAQLQNAHNTALHLPPNGQASKYIPWHSFRLYYDYKTSLKATQLASTATSEASLTITLDATSHLIPQYYCWLAQRLLAGR